MSATPSPSTATSRRVPSFWCPRARKACRNGFQEALDQIGAEEDAGTDFAIQVVTRAVDRGVELLADNELHPAFPRDALDIIKGQVSRVVAAQLNSPGYLMQRSLREALYPKGDPTLRDATPQSVRSSTTEDVTG